MRDSVSQSMHAAAHGLRGHSELLAQAQANPEVPDRPHQRICCAGPILVEGNGAAASRRREFNARLAGKCWVRATCIGLAAFSVHYVSQAQPLPGGALPGRIEQDLRRPPEPAQSGPILLDQPLYPEQVPPGAAQRRFVLRGVELSGNDSVPSSQLAPLWEARIGKEISVADAFSIAESITASYRERGFVLSQAIVPQQELPVEGASLRLEVVEGFIDRIRIAGPPELETRLQPLVAPLRNEHPLRLATMERYLLLLNERAGIVAQANLSRSPTVAGASDLDIVVTQIPAAYSVSVHNRSSDALGRIRIEAGAEWRDPLHIFDRHTVHLATSGDAALAFLAYNFDVPVGMEGSKLTLGASSSRSKPKSSPLQPYTFGDTLALGVSHPFLRSRRTSIDGRISFSGYNNGSDVASIGLSRDHIRALRLGVAADMSDDIGGINLVDLEWSKGLSVLGASQAGDPRLSRIGADPQFTKATLYAARLQSLGRGVSALVAVTGQYSDDLLVSAEQFGLGGESFLRAFDSSEVLGDRGLAVKLELRWNGVLGQFATTWYSFFDAGRAERLEITGGRTSTSLTSLGLGVRATLGRLRGFLEVAKPGKRDPVSTGNRDARIFGGIGADF